MIILSVLIAILFVNVILLWQRGPIEKEIGTHVDLKGINEIEGRIKNIERAISSHGSSDIPWCRPSLLARPTFLYSSTLENRIDLLEKYLHVHPRLFKGKPDEIKLVKNVKTKAVK